MKKGSENARIGGFSDLYTSGFDPLMIWLLAG
jgi:hypothetical protein